MKKIARNIPKLPKIYHKYLIVSYLKIQSLQLFISSFSSGYGYKSTLPDHSFFLFQLFQIIHFFKTLQFFVYFVFFTKPSNTIKITIRKYTIQTMTNSSSNNNNNNKTNPRLTFQRRILSQINHHFPQQHLSLQQLRQNSQERHYC